MPQEEKGLVPLQMESRLGQPGEGALFVRGVILWGPAASGDRPDLAITLLCDLGHSVHMPVPHL